MGWQEGGVNLSWKIPCRAIINLTTAKGISRRNNFEMTSPICQAIQSGVRHTMNLDFIPPQLDLDGP